MFNKKENNIIKLIAITLLLLVFILIIIGSSLSLSSAREDAFRVEANKVLDSSKKMVDKIKEEKIEVKNDSNSCQIKNNIYCFSVNYLINNKVYNGNSEKFIGKVIYNVKENSYELYLKKNDEFKIIAGTSSNYKKSGTLSIDDWKEKDSICNCS